MLYTKDPFTGEHLVIDGDQVFRLRSRAEALAIANQRHAKACAERDAQLDPRR